MTGRAPFIVIRAGPGATVPAGADGLWVKRTDDMDSTGRYAEKTWVAYCTGRYETRDDGQLAEVYEVPPAGWRDGL